MDSKQYKEAQKRVKKKKEFYQHLSSFVIINAFLIVLNMLTSFGHWWFVWPLFGWGIGLAFHYVDTFGVGNMKSFNSDWEEKAIQEELRRMQMEDNAQQWLEGRKGERNQRNQPDDELELKDLKKEKRKNWDDSELV